MCSMQVWAFWGLTFVASLLALAVKALPPHTTEEPIKHGRQPKWRIADAVSLPPHIHAAACNMLNVRAY